MVAGNVANMPKLFGSVRFLTTAVASEMSYSSGLQRQALFSIALVLFLFIMAINLILNVVIKKGLKFHYCMKIPCQVELKGKPIKNAKTAFLRKMEEIHVTDTISKARKIKDTILKLMMVLSAGLICSLLLGLIGYILYRGIPHISWMLVSTKPSLCVVRSGFCQTS